MSEMNKEEFDVEFDQELAWMLPRVDAPQGFAAKVMAAAETPKKAKLFAFPRVPVWATGAIAAGVIVGALAVGDVHLKHEQQRAEAQRQFETATQITDRALEHARQQLAKAGISLEE
jgi:hypothetical protein